MSKKRCVNSVIASIARPPNYRSRALEVDGGSPNLSSVLDHRDGDDPDERDGEANRRRETGNGNDEGCCGHGDEHSESPEFLSRSPQRQSHSTREQCDTECQRQAAGDKHPTGGAGRATFGFLCALPAASR